MAKPTGSKPAFGLAFETSSAVGEVALGRGPDVIDVRQFSGPRRHAVEFVATIDSVCRSNDVRPAMISAVFVSCGPGSFTGLRIGVTAARMMGLANEASIVAVPTLEVIAQNALLVDRATRNAGEPDPQASGPPSRVAVVLDAKRRRVYASAFSRLDDRYVAVSDPVEADPGEFLAEQRVHDRDCAVLGEGVHYHREAVEASGLVILPDSLFRPRAATVYTLGALRASQGEFTNHRSLIPTYIRPPEAEEKWRERHGGS
jgi:tRNA threonylcarbamoyladenosine biosynthesis protein TsaB